MKRRDFLAACAAAPLIGCSRKSGYPLPPGTLGGTGLALGHRLREGRLPAPGEVRRTPLLIVGAGIAGLSAAWRLERAGFRDFLILELEDQAGGNSRYGENPVSAHPLGAHYLPLPSREATAVRELLADLGAIEADPQAERPRYDERLLCHTPQERVYHKGFWEDGLLPHLGAGRAERDQFARFQARMAEFKEARDAEGRRAFALPVAEASRDARWRLLDTLTMAEWLAAEGFDSERLHWYVNYACRDDYGTDYRQTSAWAGIHYFACRNGQAANAAGDAVLTAPEGNGWIVRRLARRYADRLQTGALTFHLAQDRKAVHADVWLSAEDRAVRFTAERAIWAAPLFVLPHVAEGLPPAVAAVARGHLPGGLGHGHPRRAVPRPRRPARPGHPPGRLPPRPRHDPAHPGRDPRSGPPGPGRRLGPGAVCPCRPLGPVAVRGGQPPGGAGGGGGAAGPTHTMMASSMGGAAGGMGKSHACLRRLQ